MDDIMLVDIFSCHKKRSFSKEHKEKISKAKKGKHHSEDHCKNISESLKGKSFTEDHKEKIRQALQGNKNALKHDIRWSDELLSQYGHDKECRDWIKSNKCAIDSCDDVRTDYQLSQDCQKERIAYDDSILVRDRHSTTNPLEMLVVREELK